MNRILKTPIYNSFYYAFLNADSRITGFLPSLDTIDWDYICQSLNSENSRYTEVKQILASQNSDLTSEKAGKNIMDLKNPQSIILITGQQLGVFASPIYTIYKIITTIKLADKLNHESAYQFIPVFWLETEDHDFQEIRSVGIMDRQFNPLMIQYEGKDKGKVPLRYYQIEGHIDSMITDIFSNLLETEFSDELQSMLKEYYQLNRPWQQSVRDLLKDLFSATGLLFFEPGADDIKTISVEFFKYLLNDNKKITQTFADVSSRLDELGFPNQVKHIPGKTFIHIESADHQRFHLTDTNDGFFLDESEPMLDKDQIVQFITENPQRVSTSVISRPLLQSWLLPVAAYIAGPAEIAYWAQMGSLFKDFNLTLPLVYPRLSATLIEPKIERYIDRYSINVENIPLKRDVFLEGFFKNQVLDQQNDPFNRIRSSLNDAESHLIDYLNSIDPTLKDPGKKTIERMQQTLDNFEKRVLKATEDREKHLTGHLEQTHAAFFPAGVPQERYLSLVYFLNKFGPDFIDHLMNSLELDNFQHQMVTL